MIPCYFSVATILHAFIQDSFFRSVTVGGGYIQLSGMCACAGSSVWYGVFEQLGGYNNGEWNEIRHPFYGLTGKCFMT